MVHMVMVKRTCIPLNELLKLELKKILGKISQLAFLGFEILDI